MEYLTGCLICGGEPIYSERSTTGNCCYCWVTEATNARCSNGHYVTGITQDIVVDKIRMARKRAEDVKGGFCGLQGACGAAIGAGIFVSVITRGNPACGQGTQVVKLDNSRMFASDCRKWRSALL